jgi:hypothetical protein
MKRMCLCSALLIATVLVVPAAADVKTAAVRETTEFVMKKFGKEAAEEGAELLSKRIGVLAAKHGDDALTAVKNVGPRALRAAEEAGEQGGVALQAMARYGDDGLEWVAKSPKGLGLAAKYGDDAAAALAKHKQVAEPLVEQFGNAGAKALRAVDAQSGRRLAMMAGDGELKQIGRTEQLLDVVAHYGDKAADFIWRNKGALAVGTVLTAFLADPQPFLDGTRDFSQIVAENAVKPLAQGFAAGVDWTVLSVVVVMVVALVAVWRSYLRHRAELRRAAAK